MYCFSSKKSSVCVSFSGSEEKAIFFFLCGALLFSYPTLVSSYPLPKVEKKKVKKEQYTPLPSVTAISPYTFTLLAKQSSVGKARKGRSVLATQGMLGKEAKIR